MSNIFALKTNRAFYQTILMVIIAVIAMFFLSFKTYQLSGLYINVLMHKIINACGCADMAQFLSMHPVIFGTVIFFGIGIGIFILYSLYKLVKLISQTKKYIAYYLSFAGAEHSVKLKAAIKALDLDGARIIEINNPESAVFCFGFWHPKICISRALISMLDKDELEAVLIHEAQHMISYEPFKVFIIKYFHHIFFFLPGFKISAKKYFTFSELAADEKASGNSAERSCLASAILKISEQEENLRYMTGSSLSFFTPAIEERASRLSDETYIPKLKFLDKSLIIGSLGLAAASLMFIFVFSSSTKAFEMHKIASCVAPAGSEGDLACSLISQQKNGNTSSDIFNNLDNADFHENSTCRAD
ncbi:MAG: M56 family metallopeptidase [bacterium]|nr:M56 family metallopeptidase [bacterium]